MKHEDYGAYSGSFDDEYESSRTATRGRFTGRGPQGYRRSDERILEEVVDRLTWNENVDATHINVTVSDGEVTLEGTVDERQQKFIAEDTAAGVPGVVDVHNRLRIEAAQSLRDRADQIFSNAK